MAHKNGSTKHEVLDAGPNGATTQRKGGLTNTLYPPGPRPGAGPRMKNHCMKFWWCDLLVIVVIVLAIVLPVVFVAIPHKAQSDINASTLEVTSQEVTSPQPESVHIKLASVAKSGSSFHPTIEGFRAGLHLAGKEPFIYLDVPDIKADAETNINVEQDAPIANMDAFKEYNKLVIGAASFDVYMTGKTKVHQKGLSAISIDYDKKVTMQGLNKLEGLNITNIRILSGQTGSNKVLPDGSNMVSYAIVPNPSVMTIALGNVTMDLSVDGTAIGTSQLSNMLLKPGQNNITMQSTVDQLGVIKLVSTKYKDGKLPIDVKGNSSVVDGKHLAYFEEAIKSNSIKVNLDVGPALASIGINITNLI